MAATPVPWESTFPSLGLGLPSSIDVAITSYPPSPCGLLGIPSDFHLENSVYTWSYLGICF